MPKHGKKFRTKFEGVDRTVLYSVEDGIKKVIDSSYAKFDETFDVAMKLGVDPRHADQMIRSSVSLPHGTCKVSRVLVFAKGPKEA